MNLIEIHKTFQTDDQCTEHLAKLRWPDGVRCVTCGTDKVKQYSSPTKKQPGRKVYECQEPTCKQQFTATSGTIFHDTHLPLTKWFVALSLLVDAKKSISAKQLQRHLGTGYKTAWYLAHRIRKAMEETDPRPKLGGIVEMDETYVGGRKLGFGPIVAKKAKEIVIGIRQRDGELRMFHVEDVKSGTLAKYIRENVSDDVDVLVTDSFPAYKYAVGPKKHETVNHIAKEWVRGNVHTNTIESAFSLLKRGIVGSFHRISIKHLKRYLAEFEYRYNRRDNLNRFKETLGRMAKTKPMPFEALTAEPS
jgi:hypothetical protein